MTSHRKYVVSIRGDIPQDICERVSAVHAQAIAIQKETTELRNPVAAKGDAGGDGRDRDHQLESD